MNFPKYDEYKESGIEWLDEIPSNWNIVALKYLVSLKSGDGITGESIHETGRYPVYGGNGLRGYTDDFTHDGHYVVIGRQGALCGNINYADGPFWASEHAVVASPRKQVNTIWLGEMLRTMNLNQYSISAAQPGLSMELVGNLRTILPPPEEQTAIANFLDAETAKIDALVAEQRRLIELLKEKRQAVISHAVTKGLNPNAPLKDSGIEWLGEVPEHWEMKRLKHLSPFISVGIVVNPTSYVSDDENDLPFIYGGDIREGVIDTKNCRRINSDSSESQDKTILHEGDVLTVRVGAPGVTAVVPKECEGGNCASVMLMRRGNFNSHWLCYVMNTRVVRFQVEIVQYGAAQKQFNIAHAVNFWVPTPPREEQEKIVANITEQIGKFDQLQTKAEQAIELLKERRTALISAAVTGKIDVREYQVQETA